MTDIKLNMLAGQKGIITITSVDGFDGEVLLTGAAKVKGSVQAFDPDEADERRLIIPPMPQGVWPYAVLCNGATVFKGCIYVADSPLIEDGVCSSWAVAVSRDTGILNATVTLSEGPQGPQGETGPQGEPGASAYDLAVAAGYTGTQDEWATAQMECAQQAADAAASASAALAAASEAAGSAGAAALSATSARAASDAAANSASSAGAAQTAAAASAASAAESAAAVLSWHRVIPVFGVSLPADTELHHGDEVILIPEADSIDLAAAFAPASGTYAVKFTLINESEAYLLVRDGEQMLCLVKPHSQIDGMAVRSDEALHVSVDQGAISEQTFAPDGTDEDVITLSDDGNTCVISWPNKLWTSHRLSEENSIDYKKATRVEFNAPQLLSADYFLAAISLGSGTATIIANLPELRRAENLCKLTGFAQWVGDMPKLEDGTGMFHSSAVTSFEGDISQLKTGDNMFNNCGLTSWDKDFPELTSASQMFTSMPNMTSFRTKMPKVTSSASFVNGSKVVSVEISASKQASTTWFGSSPIETLRLSVPSFQKLDFSTSGIGACTPLETLEIFEDTDADGVMHAGLETCTTIKFYATHTSLSATSVQNIVDAVEDWSASSGVSALMQMPAGELTEEQKSTLTAKGWTYSEV